MADASKITMTQGDAPSTPAAGTVILYSKTGGGYYYKGADGVEHAWNETDDIITVPHGGSGTSALTDHGILLGSGTDPITAMTVGASGKLVKGVTGGDPVWSTVVLTEGSNQFKVTNGSASIEVNGAVVDIAEDVTIEQELVVAGDYGITLESYGQANALALNESLTIGAGYAGTIRFTAAGKTLSINQDTTLNGAPSGGGDFLVMQVFS